MLEMLFNLFLVAKFVFVNLIFIESMISSHLLNVKLFYQQYFSNKLVIKMFYTVFISM